MHRNITALFDGKRRKNEANRLPKTVRFLRFYQHVKDRSFSGGYRVDKQWIACLKNVRMLRFSARRNISYI